MQPLATIATTFAVVAILAAPALSAERIYIPLGSDDAIIVIDPVTDAVVSHIDGIPAVHGLAATPDGRFLIAGNYDEWEAGSTKTEKPAGMAEDEHAAHHSMDDEPGAETTGAVESTVSIIDLETGLVGRRVGVPGAVHHVSVDPMGRFAALTQPNQGAITVLDLVDFDVVATIATGPLPNYAVFSPDGQRLYVSNSANNTLSDISVDGWIVMRNVVVGESPEHVVLSTDGKTLYVNNIDDGTVSLVDTQSWSVINTFAAGDVLHGIDLSADGKTIFIAARGDDSLIAVDLESESTTSATLSPSPYHLAAIRGFAKLYISSSDEPKVWVVDQETLSLIGEIDIGGRGHQMVQVSG